MGARKPKPGKSRSALGKLSRRKGRSHEQEVARLLRKVYGEGVKRGWQARRGEDASDIEGTPWWVECKRHRRVNVQAAFAQAEEARKRAGDGRPSLLAVRDDGEPLLAVLGFEHLQALLAASALRALAQPPAAPVGEPGNLRPGDQLLAPAGHRALVLFVHFEHTLVAGAFPDGAVVQMAPWVGAGWPGWKWVQSAPVGSLWHTRAATMLSYLYRAAVNARLSAPPSWKSSLDDALRWLVEAVP